MRTETMALIERLSPEQREDLVAGLIEREKKYSRGMAVTIADLLASYLRVLGMNDHAATVNAIHDELLKS